MPHVAMNLSVERVSSNDGYNDVASSEAKGGGGVAIFYCPLSGNDGDNALEKRCDAVRFAMTMQEMRCDAFVRIRHTGAEFEFNAFLFRNEYESEATQNDDDV